MIAVVTLNWGIFKPVLKILEERKNRTVGEKEKAKAFDQRALEMTTLLEKRMEEARQIGLRRKEETRSTGEKFGEGVLKTVRLEMTQKMEELRTKIEAESKKATLQLRQYAQEISREIASKVLEREI